MKIRPIFILIILSILIGCNHHNEKDAAIEVIYEHGADSANQTTIASDSVIVATDTVQAQTETIPTHKPLTIIIKNLASATAPVIVSVYGTKNKFLDAVDQLKQYKFTPNGKELNTQITDLEYGELAFASYQDVNEDGKINRNAIGMPKEPYCFSNGYKPTVRAPKFKECRFYYNDSINTVTTTMIR